MLYIDQIQVDRIPPLALKKNSLKHATKIYDGHSELHEQRYLKMTALMMVYDASIYKPINKASYIFSKN